MLGVNINSMMNMDIIFSNITISFLKVKVANETVMTVVLETYFSRLRVSLNSSSCDFVPPPLFKKLIL